MEKDNEAKGDGNSYTTELRQYDPRLGRWLSIDPLVYNFPQQSPYVGYDNNPIYFVDPHGGSSKKNGGGDDDWRKKKFNPQGQRVVATDGENQLIPSNATPLLNDKGQTAGYIGYGNRLFTYVNDGKQKGYIDQEGLHSYYYEREYDIYQQYNGDWRYTAWKVIHTVGGDGAKLLGDPVGYAKDIYKSIQNIDIGKTWEAIQNMSDVEQKNFAGSVIFGLITGSPKKAMWTLGAHSSALRNIASHAVKHAHEFGITGAKTASRYYQAATKFFDAPPSGTLIKVQKNGDILLWDRVNNVHGVITKDGTPKTFYKPSPKAGGNANGHNFTTNDDWWNAKPSIYSGSIQ